MPKNDRQTYRQELDRAMGNLDWAMEHLRRMAETYKPHHEEVAEVCELAGAGLLMIQELMVKLKEMI
jgi:hypothetical protein